MEREKYGDAISYLPTPIIAIKQAVCFYCFQNSSSLSKCTACKRVAYCSSACQKKDWNEDHKKTCKILVFSNKGKVKTSPEGRTWQTYREEKWKDVKQFRAQNPGYHENQHRLMMYEPHCRHCYRNITQLQGGEKLKPCETCLIVSFCSACPPEHRASECQTLQEISNDDEWLIKRYAETRKSYEILCTETPKKEYVALSTAANWYEYYFNISDKTDFKPMVTRELRLVPNAPPDAAELLGVLRCGSGTGTMALTVIAALEKAFPDISTRSSITLHFIGAASWELSRLIVFEELLHLLPALKELKLTFVGFEIPKQTVAEMGINRTFSAQCCPDCTTRGRTRILSLWQGAYHDFLRSNMFEKPDLAVAFQTGFSQESRAEWLPTIEYLSHAHHPTLLTCYNEIEMREETSMLRALGANFIQTGELNKWKGICPILEALEKKENVLYYLNQYWYIIGPAKK